MVKQPLSSSELNLMSFACALKRNCILLLSSIETTPIAMVGGGSETATLGAGSENCNAGAVALDDLLRLS